MDWLCIHTCHRRIHLNLNVHVQSNISPRLGNNLSPCRDQQSMAQRSGHGINRPGCEALLMSAHSICFRGDIKRYQYIRVEKCLIQSDGLRNIHLTYPANTQRHNNVVTTLTYPANTQRRNSVFTTSLPQVIEV